MDIITKIDEALENKVIEEAKTFAEFTVKVVEDGGEARTVLIRKGKEMATSKSHSTGDKLFANLLNDMENKISKS